MFSQLSSKTKFINFIFALCLTIIFPRYMSDDTLRFSNSPFALLFLTAVFMLLCFTDIRCSKTKRIVISANILGFIFSLMLSSGRILSVEGSIDFCSFIFWSYVFLFAVFFGRLLNTIWNIINTPIVKVNSHERDQHGVKSLIFILLRYIYSHPIAVIVILLLCWLPCYLSTFPGGFRYDATPEYNQLEHGYSGNFPLLHSYLVTRFISSFYKITGSYNTGIAVYTITQMILFAMMYSHIIYVFYRSGIKLITINISFLWCAFFPVIPMLTTQMLRDVLFSGLITYTAFWLFLLCRSPRTFLKSVYKPTILSFLFVLTLLARNNNAGPVMLVVIIGVSIISWLLLKKVNSRGATIFSYTSIVCYFILSNLLVAACQPLTKPTAGASLSLFSQPIIRAYLATGKEWSKEEIKEINTYFNLKNIRYVPENADPTKSKMKINENLGDFLRFWLTIGRRYPSIYLNAIMANTREMWDPEAVIDGYQKASVGAYRGTDKCYYSFSTSINKPGHLINLIPVVNDFYKKIGLFISFEKIPVVSVLFSIGFQFWLVLICFFQAIAYKNRRLYLPILIILMYALISAFVPLVILRYFAALFIAFPLTVTFLLEPNKVLNIQK